LMQSANGEVKTAIVMGKIGVDAETALRRLEKARGHVRGALKG
jgi:N-acetylmuramic acid 6-phosphate (MurNAc-6-P) etherase